MKPKISIIVPTIRPNRWKTFCDSIIATTNHHFEVIFVGPFPITKELEGFANIKTVRDFGSPNRCRQMCIPLCQGDIITWGADDSVFLPNALNEVIDSFPSDPAEYKTVFVGTYTEGINGTNKTVQDESYWKIVNSHGPSPYIDKDWCIFNTAFMSNRFITELGGFDCCFEGCATADNDIAVRAYRAGAKVVKLKNMVYDTDWAPGIHGYGDHEPIWNAQVNYDEPLYKRMHNDPALKDRMNISMDNWKQYPYIWSKRFTVS